MSPESIRTFQNIQNPEETTKKSKKQSLGDTDPEPRTLETKDNEGSIRVYFFPHRQKSHSTQYSFILGKKNLPSTASHPNILIKISTPFL